MPTGDREQQITDIGSGGLANLAEYAAVRRGERSDAVVDARLGGAWHDEKGVAGQILEPSPLTEGDAMSDGDDGRQRLSAVQPLGLDPRARPGVVEQADIEVAVAQLPQLQRRRQVPDLRSEVDTPLSEQADEGLQPLQRHVWRTADPELHPRDYGRTEPGRQSGKFRISRDIEAADEHAREHGDWEMVVPTGRRP